MSSSEGRIAGLGEGLASCNVQLVVNVFARKPSLGRLWRAVRVALGSHVPASVLCRAGSFVASVGWDCNEGLDFHSLFGAASTKVPCTCVHFVDWDGDKSGDIHCF